MGSLSDALGGDSPPLRYPHARRDHSVVDDYHGVRVPDPYRWLEDPDAEEVKEFVKAQAEVTEEVLGACCERETLRQHMKKMFNYPRYSAPQKHAGKYFFFRNTGLQPHSLLLVQDGLDNEPEVLLDLNKLGEGGKVALKSWSVSSDAKYLAYGLSLSGSDWMNVKVMRVEDKEQEPDYLMWVKFSSFSWTLDGKGFFYGRYPSPQENQRLDAGTENKINLNHEIYYHFLGTSQSEDILCWKDVKHPKYIFRAGVVDDGRYVLLNIRKGCAHANKVYYCDLAMLSQGLEGLKSGKSMLPFVELVDKFEARYTYVSNDGTSFTFLTNKEAPKNKLVRVDIENPDIWMDVLEESEKDVLQSAHAVNKNQLLVLYLSDVRNILQLRDLKSGELLHQLPMDLGSVSKITGNRDDSEVFVHFTSFHTPGIIYKCNLETEIPKLDKFRETTVAGFHEQDLDVKQVFVSSKDGTDIPLFVICKKNICLDGSHPAVLYGYGGFNISVKPSFSVSRVVLTMRLGVVFCIANIRGGGEYGEEWHRDGSLSQKQNCFDDFIAAAEFLVSSGYTSRKRLCIEGASNGGLLVAACINQRPDLFGCAIARFGVMDMLRFHKFTIGHAWTSDYGCSNKEEEFQWLIKYSPLHNVKRPWEQRSNHTCQYPPTMLVTGDHDDRVAPLHTFKLLATMQYILCTSLENSPQTNPIIGRIIMDSGHRGSSSTQRMIDEAVDRYAFMIKMLGITWVGG